MKWLLALLVALVVPPVVHAQPPKIVVAPSGETRMVAGSVVVVVKPDGTMIISGPTVDLTLSTRTGPGPIIPPGPIVPPGPGPIVPPGPGPVDPLAEALTGIWGGLRGNPATLARYITALETVAALTDQCKTKADLSATLRAHNPLAPGDLRELRDTIADSLTATIGADDGPLDHEKIKSWFARVIGILKTLK